MAKNRLIPLIILYCFISNPVSATTYAVTSTATENAGATAGDLANAINSANGSTGNTIRFDINSAVNYNAGAMPAITNLPMTLDGNGKTALSLRTTATQLFNVTGATNSGTLLFSNMLSGLPILQAVTAVSSGNTAEFSQSGNGSLTFAITGAGAVKLSLSSAVQVTFSGTNTYSGGTNFTTDGIFIIGSNSAFGTGAVTFGTGAIRASGTRTVTNSFSLAADANIDGSSALTLSGAVNLGANNLNSKSSVTTTLSGVISGVSGKVTQNNSTGILVISGNNTYTGGTYISSGIVSVGNANALGTGPIYMRGGTLRSNTGTQTLPNNIIVESASILGGTNNLVLNGTVALGTNALSIRNTGGTVTVSGVISDTSSQGSIVVNGTGGTMALTGANTYEGGTTVTAGTLSIGNNSALGTGELVLNGGNFRSSAILNAVANSWRQTAASFIGGTSNLTITGAGNLSSHLLTVNNTSNNITLNGVISDSGLGGALTKSGAGTLVLNATNTYSGATNLNAGTTIIGSSGAFGSGALNMGGGTLQANTTLTLSKDITLGANSTISGTTAFTLDGDISLAANRLTVGPTSPGNVTLNGIISGTGGTFTKSGTGTAILAGENTFTGGTTLTAGSLIVTNSNSLGTGDLTFNAGSLRSNTSVSLSNDYSLSANSTINGSEDLTLSGAGDLTTRVLTVSNTANTVSLTGVLSNTSSAGRIVKSSNGALLLSGSNTFDGGITLTAGTIIVGNAQALGTGTFTFNGGALQSDAAYTVTNNYTFSNSSTINGSNDLALSGTGALTTRVLTISNTAGTVSLTGVLSSTSTAGRISKTGAGTLFLSGNNTFTGGVTVSAGTLIVGHENALGTGGLTLSGGALQSNDTYTLSSNVSLTTNSTINGSNNLTLSGAVALTNDTLTVDNSAGTVTLSGVISSTNSSGKIIKAGAGTLALTGSNTFTGGITHSGGVLLMGHNNSLGTATLTLNGGSLRSSTDITASNSYSLNADTTIDSTNDFTLSGTGDLNAQKLTINATGAEITLSGVVGDSSLGGSVSVDAGTLTLGNNNTYSGGTIINGGTLKASTANALPTTGAVTVNSGIFNLNANAQTIGDLTGAGNVSVGTSTLTFGSSTTSSSFSGVVSGSGSLVKQGSGIVVLTGNNTFTGTTTINDGVLRVDNRIAGPITVSSGGILGGSGTVAGAVTNNGIVNPLNADGNASTLTMNSYSVGAGGTTRIRLNPNGTSSKIVTTGNASLNGALIFTLDEGDFQVGTTYIFLDAASVSGSFSSTPSTVNNLKVRTTYNSTNVTFTLELTGIRINKSATNANGTTIANYLNSLTIPSGSDLEVTLGALGSLNPAETAVAMRSISPGKFGSTSVSGVKNSTGVNKINSGRLSGLRSNTQSSSAFNQGFDRQDIMNFMTSETAKQRTTSFGVYNANLQNNLNVSFNGKDHNTFWVNPFASYSETDPMDDDEGFHASSGGVAFGLDRNIRENIILGVSVGNYKTMIDTVGFGDKVRINTIFATIYGTYLWQNYFLEASLLAGKPKYRTTQVISYGNLSRTSSGKHKGYDFAPHISVGFDYMRNDIKVTPFIGFDYTHSHEKGHQLIGANSLEMYIEPRNAHSLQTELGVKLSHEYTYYGHELIAEGQLSYTFINARNGSMTSSLVGQSGSFSAANYSRDSYQISPACGLTLKLKHGGYIRGFVSSDFGPNYKSFDFNLVYSKKF